VSQDLSPDPTLVQNAAALRLVFYVNQTFFFLTQDSLRVLYMADSGSFIDATEDMGLSGKEYIMAMAAGLGGFSFITNESTKFVYWGKNAQLVPCW